MKSERVYSIINYFLYFLLLIALGIILYLLYSNWQNNNFQQAMDATGNGVEITDRPEEENGQATSHSSQMGSFSYAILADWTIEENTEADYAVIRNKQEQNIVSVRIITKTDSMKELSFEDYARQAAANEIQGYQSLESIEKIQAENGIIGYKTTWNIQFLGGEEFISNPITYFEHPFDPDKSIQFSLENAEYIQDYDNIIHTFRIEE